MTGVRGGKATCRLFSESIFHWLSVLSFFFISGLDFIGGEGSNYPRKFDTAPGTIHPGALTAPDTFIVFFKKLKYLWISHSSLLTCSL